ncbi:ATP-binding protein [Alicyclobacillus pomorum]
MRHITTVKLGDTEYPFGPLVCDCPEFVRKREEERRQREEQERLEQDRQREAHIEALFRRSALPERWRTRTFERFEVTPANTGAFATAKAYAEGFDPEAGKGLLLTGTVGTGKTHLAAAIAMELIGREHTVVFGTVTSLLAQVRSAYGDDRVSEMDMMRRFTRCNLLIIDDLGKERVSDWVEQTVYEIINTRYERNRSLIITTNMSLAEIRAKYVNVGNAIVDRILEMCQGIRMVGDSWRHKALL